tara:strand:- start:187 stop:639 length:453 start_codon:yes stop_codon:yes gene_type:complete
LLAQEIARLTGQILIEWSAVQKKLAQAKPHTEAYADLQSQLSVLMSKWFVRDTPYEKLVHFPRYLKAVQMRIDKLKSDPQRDRQLMADMAPLLIQYQRALNALKGAPDAQLADFRWMLEELRVSLFAQTLRTPMPVSVKRLQKAWSAMHR